jgi:hypothetical protein
MHGETLKFVTATCFGITVIFREMTPILLKPEAIK